MFCAAADVNHSMDSVYFAGQGISHGKDAHKNAACVSRRFIVYSKPVANPFHCVGDGIIAFLLVVL